MGTADASKLRRARTIACGSYYAWCDRRDEAPGSLGDDPGLLVSTSEDVRSPHSRPSSRHDSLELPGSIEVRRVLQVSQRPRESGRHVRQRATPVPKTL